MTALYPLRREWDHERVSPPETGMVGRDAEAARLRAVFEEARQGRPRTALIAGEAGIGKSRLITEFLDGLDSSTQKLVGRCVDFGAVAPPLAPVVSAIRPLVAELGPERVLAVTRSGGEALLRFVGASGSDSTPLAEMDRLNEAIIDVLETVATEHPVVLVVEDIHWADPATLHLLSFATRLSSRSSLMVVVSYRDDELPRGHRLRPLLAEWERDRQVERIAPRRLGRNEVREQARRLMGADPSASRVDALLRRSEGVPFFVEELIDLDPGSSDEVPSTISELLLGRYDALDLECRYVARVIAAGGDSVDHALLAAVLQRDEEELDRCLLSAIDVGLLRVVGIGYAFRHALVRDAVSAESLPGERMRVHRRYAEALTGPEGSARSGLDRVVLVANHWMQANMTDRAFDSAVAAMRLSADSSAHATAAQMGERLLDLWDIVDAPADRAGSSIGELLPEIARAWYRAGEPARAIAFVEQALSAVPPDEVERRAWLLVDLGDVLLGTQDLRRREVLEAALALLSDDADPALRTRIVADLSGESMMQGDYVMAIRLATDALTLSPQGTSGPASRAANYRGISRVALLDFDAGLADLELSRELAGDDLRARSLYYANGSSILLSLGKYQECLRLAREGLAFARSMGVERSFGHCMTLNTIEPLFATGRWAESDAAIEHLSRLDPPPTAWLSLVRVQIRATMWRGLPEDAWASYRALAPEIERITASDEPESRASNAADYSLVALARDDVDSAWSIASTVVRGTPIESGGFALPALGSLALVIARRRRDGDAQELRDAEHELRAQLGHHVNWPTHEFWSTFCEAALGGPTGTGDDPAAWEVALTALETPSAPVITRLLALRESARAQLLAGRRADAAEALGELRRQGEDVGSGLAVSWAETDTRAAGLGDVSASSDSALTSREEQVLELIAEGLSNGQIGARLFISPKTVSVHVSAILRKLGATTRTQAAHLARA